MPATAREAPRREVAILWASSTPHPVVPHLHHVDAISRQSRSRYGGQRLLLSSSLPSHRSGRSRLWSIRKSCTFFHASLAHIVTLAGTWQAKRESLAAVLWRRALYLCCHVVVGRLESYEASGYGCSPSHWRHDGARLLTYSTVPAIRTIPLQSRLYGMELLKLPGKSYSLFMLEQCCETDPRWRDTVARDNSLHSTQIGRHLAFRFLLPSH